jgi:hypothetical protein
MFPFKLRLIEGKSIAGRLRYPVADALRTGIPCYFTRWSDRIPERGSSKTGWRFGRRLLRYENNCDGCTNNRKDNDLFVFHGLNLLEVYDLFRKTVSTTELLWSRQAVYHLYAGMR